jgi:hypothetical protein
MRILADTTTRGNPVGPNDHAHLPTDHPILVAALDLLSRSLRPVIVYPPGFPRRNKPPATGKEPFGPVWGV